MTRSRCRIEIEGQFAQNVRGTFAIIRGFSNLQELAGISAPCLIAYDPSLHLTRLSKRGFDQLPPLVRERFGNCLLTRAKPRSNQIRRAVAEIKTSAGIVLEWIDSGSRFVPVMPIHPHMYAAVQSADIILIDLTGNGRNVGIEAGHALRHLEKRGLVFLFQPRDDDDAVTFDLDTCRYEPITVAAEISGKLALIVRTFLEETAQDRQRRAAVQCN